jgi:hypothetical protein
VLGGHLNLQRVDPLVLQLDLCPQVVLFLRQHLDVVVCLTKLRGKRVDALQRDLVCRHLLLQRLHSSKVSLSMASLHELLFQRADV